MNQLLTEIITYLDDRSDADYENERYKPNAEMYLHQRITENENVMEDTDLWVELSEYFETRKPEWYDQIENYIVNNSIG